MPDVITNEPYKKSAAVRKASLSYGGEFLTDISPSDQPYSGAWDVIRRLQEFPLQPPYTVCSTPAVSPEAFVCIKIGWPEKEKPFTQENLLDSEEEQFQELLLLFKTSPFISDRESLASSLATLFADAKEEDPTSIGIAVGSLHHFYNFLRANPHLKCPIVSLTPDYNIYSTWRDGGERLFSVHFLPNGDVRFVLFIPNEKHLERKLRLSGIATADILLELVAPYDVLEWISE